MTPQTTSAARNAKHEDPMQFFDQMLLDELTAQEATTPAKPLSRASIVMLAALLAIMALVVVLNVLPSVSSRQPTSAPQTGTPSPSRTP